MTNNPQSNPSFPLKVTLLLETLASGEVAASIFEFPQCHVEAPSRESAISQLKAIFLERMANIETLTWEISPPEATPAWLAFAGTFRNDPDFASITESLRAEHTSDNESEVNPSYYLQNLT